LVWTAREGHNIKIKSLLASLCKGRDLRANPSSPPFTKGGKKILGGNKKQAAYSGLFEWVVTNY